MKAMNDRIKKLQKTVKNEQLDALLVNEPSNNYYLTGISDAINSKGYYSIVFPNNYKFATTKFHLGQVLAKMPKKDIITAGIGEPLSETISKALDKANRVGFESSFTYAQYETFKKALRGKKLVPTAGLVEKIREIKDKEEISLIKKAAAITDKTFDEVLKLIRPGVTESWLKRKIAEIMEDQGATGMAFEPIVASGLNSAQPHYEGSARKIKKNQMVVIDMGAVYKHYRSDMTRTVFIGRANAKFKQLYNIVLETQIKAIEKCQIGTLVSEPNSDAIRNFKKYRQDKFFITSLGHGVGVHIHELPNLAVYGTGEFRDGMVFTVEPGIYHSDFGGIRIEDLCLMENGKCKILSKSPKHLIEVT